MLNSFNAKRIDGTLEELEIYENKVALVVNTASFCGYTPQLKALETLYQDYQDRGFVVLGFPCNQFKEQDPHDNATIASFCMTEYGVSFPLFEKIEVNGEHAHPLFKALKEAAGLSDIRWNFTKFLIDKKGNLIDTADTRVDPLDLRMRIEEALA